MPGAAFYAAPIGLLMYAVLGSSRQLVVAVSSAVAITSAARITSLAQPGTAKYVALTAALALFAGRGAAATGLHGDEDLVLRQERWGERHRTSSGPP